MQDPYCYPNSRVFKNKLGIVDGGELSEAERNLSNLRAEELMQNPMPGRFDFEQLRKIHKYLFQDIYDWAGEVRTVDIAKGNLFCRSFAIEVEAERIFGKLRSENYLQELDAGSFVERLAYYFSEINALHPFREGNGRAQREFVRQLAFLNNYFLSYARITQEEMIGVSVESFKRNYAPLEKMLLAHLRPV